MSCRKEQGDESEELGHAQQDLPLKAVGRDGPVQGVVQLLDGDHVVLVGGGVQRGVNRDLW